MSFVCFDAAMRNLAASSIILALAACFATGAAVDACGGTTFSEAGLDGGSPPDAAAGEAGDATTDGTTTGPRFDEPLTVFGAYAVRTIFLGETDRSGVPTKDAWKEYGENLDGLVTTRTSTDVCRRVGGADSSKQEDGNGGIDNSFGRTVLGFILGLVPTPSKTTNDQLAAGGRTMMLNLAPGRVGFITAATTTAALAWNGTDVRAAAMSSVGTGPDDALSVSTTPAMSGRLVSTGIASGTFYLELALQAGTWRIPIRHARVTMNVSSDGLRATTGTLAGIAPTEELVAEIVKVAGRISTQLCGGSTLDTIKQTIRQASDILVDGPQDPTKSCDGISIGIGFEAVKVTATGIGPDPTPGPDPCQ